MQNRTEADSEFDEEKRQVSEIIAACANQKGIGLMTPSAIWNGGWDTPRADEKRVVEIHTNRGPVSIGYWKRELNAKASCDHVEQRILQALTGISS